ncbi:hypothetical protein Syun_023239 [Stephania yunnanensis]|uniref:Uncharacterized protein n=1 Tax=Stephania yunnanensis TaxID=152371 RepID=A0AAP0FM66_9MAGN
MIARKKEHCSVKWTDWRLMPKGDKQALINFTKRFFEIPHNAGVEKWILHSIACKWKEHKFEPKSKYLRLARLERRLSSQFRLDSFLISGHLWYSIGFLKNQR